MSTEAEYLERIRQLEAENNNLRDKLDLIYSIVAHEDAETDPAGGSAVEEDLVQITGATSPSEEEQTGSRPPQ